MGKDENSHDHHNQVENKSQTTKTMIFGPYCLYSLHYIHNQMFIWLIWISHTLYICTRRLLFVLKCFRSPSIVQHNGLQHDVSVWVPVSMMPGVSIVQGCLGTVLYSRLAACVSRVILDGWRCHVICVYWRVQLCKAQAPRSAFRTSWLSIWSVVWPQPGDSIHNPPTVELMLQPLCLSI